MTPRGATLSESVMLMMRSSPSSSKPWRRPARAPRWRGPGQVGAVEQPTHVGLVRAFGPVFLVQEADPADKCSRRLVFRRPVTLPSLLQVVREPRDLLGR